MTKEPPLGKVDATIRAITPGMSYQQLLSLARTSRSMHRDAPGLLRQRFLLLDKNDCIVYDRFLSMVAAEGVDSRRVRKAMYLVWALRDERIRRFVVEVIADPSGRWQPAELRNKANASFFEKWFAESSATKARSNLEFFLDRAGIFDPQSESIHLELSDGWLADAMHIAAQHETNAGRRHVMMQAPVEFLIANNLNGLINATKEQLRDIRIPTFAEPATVEDDVIVSPPRTAAGRKWRRNPPKWTSRESAASIIDLVSRERASAAHFKLERLMAQLAEAKHYVPKHNENIDMFFATPDVTVLAEMKSCHSRNVHAQVRRGVSQLSEYRFIYRKLLGEQVTMVLVIETHPPASKKWLIEYLKTLGITLAWKDPSAERFVTTVEVPPALGGIVSNAE